MYKVVINKKAQNQIENAAIWYSLKQKGLESRFLDEIDNAVAILRLNPFFAVRYANIRSILLKNFPFLLFFTIKDNQKTVKIIAVLHAHTNPQNWKS